jgi:phage shock protein A
MTTSNPLEERLRTIERDWDELRRQNNQLIELHNALTRDRNEARAELAQLREKLRKATEAAREIRTAWMLDADGRSYCALCDEQTCSCGIEALLAVLPSE